MVDTPADAAEVRLLAERAVGAVLTDLKSSAGIEPAVRVEVWSGSVVAILVDRNVTTPSMIARSEAEAIAEVAGYLQEQIDFCCWPTCLEHQTGLHPEVFAGRPVWACRYGDHVVGVIGAIGEASTDGEEG